MLPAIVADYAARYASRIAAATEFRQRASAE
jgi:hypothetical protein